VARTIPMATAMVLVGTRCRVAGSIRVRMKVLQIV
jgi:hypothetical protein